MAYQPNIPLPTDLLKNSQADIQANFISNSAAFNQNHVDFNDANAGKHKFLQMPEQSVSPVTAANEMGLYTKEQGGVAQLFVRRESNGDEINLTNDVGKNIQGWTRLANGLIVKWGYVQGIGPRDVIQPTYFYPVDPSIPIFSTVYTVVIGSTQIVHGVVVSNAWQETRLYGYAADRIQVYTSGLAAAGGDATDWTYISIGV